MGNKDYHTFLTTFLHLAAEAQVPETEYKYELNEKLSFQLRPAVVASYLSDSDFHTFSTHCSGVAQALKAVADAQTRSRGRNAPIKPSTSATTWNTPASTPRSPQPQPTTDNAKRNILIRQGRYFRYKEAGHLQWNCPKNGSLSPAEVKAMDKAATEVQELEAQEPEKGQP